MRIRAKDVALFVAAEHGLTFADFTSDCRRRDIARPRQIAMHTIKTLCPHMSYPAIGRLLGGRDHTTILHGVRKIERLLATEYHIAASVQAALDHFEERRYENTIPVIQWTALCQRYAQAMRPAA